MGFCQHMVSFPSSNGWFPPLVAVVKRNISCQHTVRMCSIFLCDWHRQVGLVRCDFIPGTDPVGTIYCTGSTRIVGGKETPLCFISFTIYTVQVPQLIRRVHETRSSYQFYDRCAYICIYTQAYTTYT